MNKMRIISIHPDSTNSGEHVCTRCKKYMNEIGSNYCIGCLIPLYQKAIKKNRQYKNKKLKEEQRKLWQEDLLQTLSIVSPIKDTQAIIALNVLLRILEKIDKRKKI